MFVMLAMADTTGAGLAKTTVATVWQPFASVTETT